MESEMEDKIAELQVCIDNGHCFFVDKESYGYDGKAPLVCTMCGYTKYVELTKEQGKKYDKLEDNMNKFLDEIVKNEELN